MNAPLVPAHQDHRRLWRDFTYCYPVISRRSRGLSLGVNLNPDKVCNYDCVYCEVDRVSPPLRRDVDLDQVDREMGFLLDLALGGELFAIPPFNSARPEQRRLNDIAFSGDGEPTACKVFPEAVTRMAALRTTKGALDCKLVLITNATRLQHPEVVRGIDALVAARGEVWAKLDAGTESHHRAINRSEIPLARIQENLQFAAHRWPIYVQTLFLAWQGQGPSEAELDAYIDRIRALRGAGSRLRGLQLYTIARPTPEAEARPLSAAGMDGLAARLRDALPDLPMDVFYGPEA